MSYIYNREIQLADTSQKDAFGRLRTSEVTSLLELKHTYDKQPLLEDEVVSGGAFSTASNSTVIMTTAGNDYIIRQSFASATYQPGKSQIFEASFSDFFITPGKDSIKRVGAFTSTTTADYDSSFDGIFLEAKGLTDEINFCIYRNNVPIVEAPLNTWLTNDYDPNLINWSRSQLMMIDYQWLGVGRVRFYMVIDGIPRLFYEYTHVNNDTGVYMLKSNLPIRYELRSLDASGDTFTQICSQISMEGSLNSLSKPTTIYNLTSATGLPAAGVFFGILGFRIKASSPVRGIVARIRDFSILQTTNDNYILQIIRNPTFTSIAPTWSNLSSTPLQYDNIGGVTYAITPGSGHVLESYLGLAGSLGSGKVALENSAIKPGFSINGTPDQFWLAVQPLTTNASFRVAMNLEYFE